MERSRPPPPRKSRGTSIFTSITRVFVPRRASDQSIDKPDNNELERRGSSWDLVRCVEVIETLQGAVGLSREQETAISQLRHSATATSRRLSKKPSAGSKFRRDAKFFGAKSRGSPLLTTELLRCFTEVEEDDDADQRQNVTAILATFGGDIFEGVPSIAPHSTESLGSKIPEESGHSLHLDTSARSLNIDSLHRYDSEVSLNRETVDSARRDAATCITPLHLTGSLVHLFDESADKLFSSQTVFCPPEWNALTKKARKSLTGLLSWENLSRWDFNILEVSAASGDIMKNLSASDADGMLEGKQHCPLLFVGWAVLCAPYAQQAMEGSLGDNENEKEEDGDPPTEAFPYNFVDNLKISPAAVCNFLRQIEGLYVSSLPYHNNEHAADVTQTLHSLIQMMGQDNLEGLYDAIDVFSILLAATFHDVGHKGMNNLYQKNARTDLAIQYNDSSILENMHSAVGNSFLMGKDKRKEWDVLKEWSEGQKEQARDVMIFSVLGTDMSKHFESMGELASLVEKVRADDTANGTGGGDGVVGELRPILSVLLDAFDQKRESIEAPNEKECTRLAKLLLKFLLHAADISNPTKDRELAIYWADRALAEFFAQGDMEEADGIPISPMCDRRTVKRADSQIGFGKFVIRPTYLLLAEILPRVKDEVLPIIDDNIQYWTRTKARLSSLALGKSLAKATRQVRVSRNKKSSIDEGDEGGESEGDESDKDEPGCGQ